jgi:hypothetical protein
MRRERHYIDIFYGTRRSATRTCLSSTAGCHAGKARGFPSRVARPPKSKYVQSNMLPVYTMACADKWIVKTAEYIAKPVDESFVRSYEEMVSNSLKEVAEADADIVLDARSAGRSVNCRLSIFFGVSHTKRSGRSGLLLKNPSLVRACLQDTFPIHFRFLISRSSRTRRLRLPLTARCFRHKNFAKLWCKL